MKNKYRYPILMLFGVVLNLSLYEVAHTFHLPAWIDSVGTVYAAVLLEPAAGLIVGFATNFFQSAVVYGSNSIVFYAISATAALSYGIILRHYGRIQWNRIFPATACYIIVGSILSCLLTLWATNGIPDSNWENHFYHLALAKSIPNILSCLFGAFVLKVIDGCILMILLPLLYKITPTSMITAKLDDPMIRKHSQA